MVGKFKKMYHDNMIIFLVILYGLYYKIVILFTLSQFFKETSLIVHLISASLIMALLFYSYKQVGKIVLGLPYVTQYLGMIVLGWFQVVFPIMLIKFILNFFFLDDEARTMHFTFILLSQILFLYALINGHRNPGLKKIVIKSTKINSEIKIVHLSDVHLGMLFLDLKWLENLVERVNQLSPDIVCITGDLFEGNIKNFAKELEVLKMLEAKHGVMYTTGNHEYLYNSKVDIEHFMRSAGFVDLNEQKILITSSSSTINISGVSDLSQYPEIKNLPALQLLDNKYFNLFLSHQSLLLKYISEADKENLDLVLSGHTHGCQIFPYGYLDLFVIPSIKGLHKTKNMRLYTSSGTGFWGPPLRYFSNSEMALITLLPADTK